MKKNDFVKTLSLSAILVISLNTIGCNIVKDNEMENNISVNKEIEEISDQDVDIENDVEDHEYLEEEINDQNEEKPTDIKIEEINNKKGYSKVELNIRKGPGTEYDVIGTLKYNDEINVTGKSDNWYRINFNDQEGFVFASHISDAKLEEKEIAETSDQQNEVIETKEEPNEEINSDGFIERALNELNAYRAENGLSAVTLSGELNKAAAIRAREASSYFSHTRPSGQEFITALDEIGYNNYSYAGENLIDGVTFSSSVIEYWKTSPSHNEAMLEPGYSQVGFAYAENPQGTLTVALIFIEK